MSTTPKTFEQRAEPNQAGEHEALGTAMFTGIARNDTGVSGESWVEGGIRVAVAAPTAAKAQHEQTNPEELLGLAWATCLNASARAVADSEVLVSVEATISLHARLDAPGYDFLANATLTFTRAHGEALTEAEADALAAAAHARCPISRLMAGSPRVTVRGVAG